MGKLYQELKEQIKKGLNDENTCIPFSLERLNYFLNISKNTMYTIGGESGSGKSNFSTEVMMISPIQWYMKFKDVIDMKLDIIYFGMERKQYRTSARWLSRLIFTEKGIYIPVRKILGIDSKLTNEEQHIIGDVRIKFEEMESYLHCYEGVVKADKIEEYIIDFANKNGKLETIKDGLIEQKKYIPNHPNHIVLIVTDHIGLIATQNKKAEIDNFSRIMREARDIYSFSPVIVQQMNRSISEVSRIKTGNLAPKLSDFQDTSGTIQDSDVVIALFDPYRHIQDNDSLGYDLNSLRDERGVKYYRSVHILKNSFDSDGISAGIGFYPFCGLFRTLPKADEMNDDIVYKIKNGNYFR